MKPKAAFLVLEGRDAGRVISIDHFPFRIGRQHDNELVIADEQVSRYHAQVEKGPGGPVISDLKSRNGLFVDGRRAEKQILRPGDRIRIGATVLVFHPDVDTARSVMVDSIPDSPAFAMGLPDRAADLIPEQVNSDEPTSVEHVVDEGPAREQPAGRGLGQISKLFVSQLPPEDCAGAILDNFFQIFGPDRALLSWGGAEEIRLARSRTEGRKGACFVIPRELEARAEKGAIATRVAVSGPKGKGAEEREILIAPLLLTGKPSGWLYGDRDRKLGSFTSPQIEELRTFAEVASGIMERGTLIHQAKSLKSQISRMEKHISPEVARLLRSKEISIEESDVGVQAREVTILFCDIEGFTPLSERLSAQELAELLNEYFQRMVDVIQAHHGHLNKFIGDAVMALFGAPESFGNDAENAVGAALGMIESLKEFRAQVGEEKRFNIRIGVNTGKVVAGNIGCEKKMEYTVLGDPVNLASRLEGISPPNTVTIGPLTAEKVKDRFELTEIPPVKVKGKSVAVQVYRVLRKLS
jgi:adenylate cyclase